VKDIDFTTFTTNFGKSEIINIKSKIKDLYRFNHVYTYKQLEELIKDSYKSYQAELFDSSFLDYALHQMIPKTENDYNNFKDTVYDKYNVSGYLIQRDKFYIFQPFNDNERTPLYNRKIFKLKTENLISIKNYMIQKYGDFKDDTNDTQEEDNTKPKEKSYDFISVQDYYNKKDDNFIVGIIDKNNLDKNVDDIFKIRPPLKKGDKKRGTGIYSLTGAVCATSKDKEYLMNKLKDLLKKLPDFKITKKLSTRSDICNEIMIFLLYLEKYSTTSKNNKINYIIIPNKHPKYSFPYNLEDRVKYRLNSVKDIIKREFTSVVKKTKTGNFTELNLKNQQSYLIEITNNKYLIENKSKIEKLGFKFDKTKITLLIE